MLLRCMTLTFASTRCIQLYTWTTSLFVRSPDPPNVRPTPLLSPRLLLQFFLCSKPRLFIPARYPPRSLDSLTLRDQQRRRRRRRKLVQREREREREKRKKLTTTFRCRGQKCSSLSKRPLKPHNRVNLFSSLPPLFTSSSSFSILLSKREGERILRVVSVSSAGREKYF